MTDGLRGRFAQAAAVLEENAEDILVAYLHFPFHQPQLYSTKSLERLNKEIKRRSHAVGIFAAPCSLSSTTHGNDSVFRRAASCEAGC